MPDQRKTQQLDIEITGSVDSSLAKAIGVTEAQLAKLKDAVNTINRGFSQQAFAGVGPAAQKGFEEAQTHASKFNDFMGKVGETMSGVFAADLAMNFFNEAIEGARELGHLMKEVSDVAANFEISSMEVQKEYGLTNKELEEMVDKQQRLSFQTPFTMASQMDTARLLGTAAPAYLDVEGKVKWQEHQQQLLHDIASATKGAHETYEEHLNEISQAYSNMLRYGYVTEQALHPLERGGIMVRPLMEKLLDLLPPEMESLEGKEKISTGAERAKIIEELKSSEAEASHDLYKMIKKAKVPSEILTKVFESLTGPGGKFYGATEQAAKTVQGLESTVGVDLLQFFQRAFGKIENEALKPFLEKVNAGWISLYPQVDAFFKKTEAQLAPIFSKDITAFFDTLGKQDWGSIAKDLDKAAEAAAKMFEKMGPLLDWFAKDLPEEIDGLLRLTTAFEKIATAIEKAFDWVVNKAGPQTPAQAASAQTRADLERQKTAEISALPQPKTPEQARDYEAKRQEIEARYKIKLESLNKSLSDLEAQIKKTSGNDFVHLEKAIESTTTALGGLMGVLQAAGSMGGGGFGLGSGYGGGGGMTEYGASVPGDQPGGPTYDWNSFHGIGAFTQHLVPGQDVAMSQAYARGHYGISPLGFYVSDKDHKMHRWADVTGSKDPTNEDLYRGALGGIFTRPTKALIGEAGAEAVIPLGRAGGLGHTFNINITGTDLGMNLREYGAQIVEIIKREISGEFAAMAAV